MPHPPFANKTYAAIYWRELRRMGGWLPLNAFLLLLSEGLTQAHPFVLKRFVNGLAHQDAALAQRWLVIALTVQLLTKLAFRLLRGLDRLIETRTWSRIDGYALRRALEQSYSFLRRPGRSSRKSERFPVRFPRSLRYPGIGSGSRSAAR